MVLGCVLEPAVRAALLQANIDEDQGKMHREAEKTRDSRLLEVERQVFDPALTRAVSEVFTSD